jgi:uncharacterized protein (UPF0333 family)
LANKKGQAVIEYILLIAAMVAIITSLMGYIKKKYLGDALKCDSQASKKTLLCTINQVFNYHNEGPRRFRYHPFKK